MTVSRGRLPIHHGGGQIFPHESLGAEVADPIALNFPFRGGLIGAVGGVLEERLSDGV